jgi:nitric-oxide synthase, bacterial
MLCEEDLDAAQLALFEQRGELHGETPPPARGESETVCTCAQVTYGRIQQAMHHGCTTLADIARETGATAVCGGCKPYVAELLGRDDLRWARIKAGAWLGPEVREFVIEVEEGAALPYVPGQHIVVQARIDHRWVQRPYTLAAPWQEGLPGYRIAVAREPQGLFTGWLFDRLGDGAPVRVSEPQGDFTLDPSPTQPAVYVVGGIGVTPALCAARAALEGSRGGARPLVIDYSASTAEQWVAADELRRAHEAGLVEVHLRATRSQGRFAAPDAQQLVGRYPQAVFLLCGSTGFVDSVAQLLLAAGAPPTQLRREAFTMAEPQAHVVPASPPSGCPGSAPAAQGASLPSIGAEGSGGEPAQAGGCPVSHGASPLHCPAEGSSRGPDRPAPSANPSGEARAVLAQLYLKGGYREGSDSEGGYSEGGYNKEGESEGGESAAFTARWAQVASELAATGQTSYRQTADELTYCARVAWRNSTRCIGRMHWESLVVRDCRHIRDGQAMLDALFEHVQLASHGGSLRPMMTVFAPQGADGDGPRVYNAQLMRYAGYRLADGTVLGDPANVELTAIATALGWEPPAEPSAFDMLPLIVSGGRGQPPVWRSYPRELVLEVAITHPTLPGIDALGLRWYALPAVASFGFDACGVYYPAAPFNGWYVGTEIGARNFTDPQRYNLLQRIAQACGLDTSSERSLWRDRALVEINVAVLASFERAGFTMVDHHSAVATFDRFESSERAAGRPVHGNWSWLVPPMSGSLTSVFHRSWPETELKPCFVAQPDPWHCGYPDPRSRDSLGYPPPTAG